jgi:hypothetical protein
VVEWWTCLGKAWGSRLSLSALAVNLVLTAIFVLYCRRCFSPMTVWTCSRVVKMGKTLQQEERKMLCEEDGMSLGAPQLACGLFIIKLACFELDLHLRLTS